MLGTGIERRGSNWQVDCRASWFCAKRCEPPPPDILLSNYSMLEYLLLRPKETPLFDNGRGATWRFLVLDEAHQYRGAKGMEIAMLLRRLKRRAREGGQSGPFQCIATSASLGGGASDRKDLAAFAAELFEEEFGEDDVITGETEPFLDPAGATFRVGPEALLTIAEHVRSQRDDELRASLARLRADIVESAPAGLPARALLHRVFSAEQRSAELRQVLHRPLEVDAVSAAVFGDVAAPDQSRHISALVDVLVAAQDPRSQAPLLSTRYHLFLRGLEGAFLRHQPRREVTLCRGSGDAGDARAFELALCRECGQHYITGRLEGDMLVEAMRDEGEADYKIQFYRPIDSEADQPEDESSVKDRALCTLCGRLSRHDGGVPTSPCGHPGVLHVRLEDERMSNEDQVRACGRCGCRAPDPVREVTHGTDGPNAVVATSLHRLLPEGRRKVLAFADGRQEAAFFAWYLGETYDSIQGRVVVLEALRRIGEVPAGEVGLHDLALEVREVLKARGAERPLTEREWLHKAWIHVLRELLSDQPRISLEGVGLVRWLPQLPAGFAVPSTLTRAPWRLSEHEAADLVRFLLDSFRTGSALQLETGEGLRVGWDDLRLKAKQSQFSIGSGPGATSWDGVRTGRAVFLARFLQSRPGYSLSPIACREAVQQALREMWESLALSGGVLENVANGKRALPRWWRARLLGAADRLERCDVCGRMRAASSGGICARYGCSGRLVSADELARGRGDHYRALYSLPLPATLRAEEHTAQIEREQAREFQEDFEAGRIHLLSCSTTFELGIDLGNLDTIFLRNVPPEPFNYAQRVGRAGRRAGHPGFAVTYCRRRPHDQTAFADPAPMLAGRASPPRLALTNEKIVLRHMTAVALAAYFGGFRDRFENKVEGLLGDMRRSTVLESLAGFLDRERSALEERLKAVVPAVLHTRLGLTDGTWIGAVSGVQGALARAVAEAADDYRKVAELQQTFVEREEFGRAKWAKARKETIAGEDVISFLSRKAVIPKYGFPVDVVELDLQGTGSGRASTVALQRDLSIAVAEFAPDAELVANKRLWRSCGIKRVAGRAWPRSAYRKCRLHGTFQSWADGQEPPADSCCDRAMPGRWVDPIFGFVADRNGGGEPQGRPRRLVTSRPYFQGVADPTSDPAPMIVGGVATLWRSSPGHLVVLCEGRKGRGFRVCGECGAGLPGATKPDPVHESPEGGSCRGCFDLVSLGHQFITDVLRIQFEAGASDMPSADRLWFHHSLAYALVHGASAHLEIPQNDLGVTVSVSGPSSHAIVLYDAVPGGAGLVARLEEPSAFKHMLETALARVEGCRGCAPDASCYGCLRHYGNQFAHPKLKRGPVAKFLAETLRSWRRDMRSSP